MKEVAQMKLHKTTHGLSHGLAVLISYLAAALLVDIARKHLPKINELLTTLADRVSREISNLFQLHLSPDTIGTLILAIGLAVIWGAAFAFLHHRE